MSAGTGILHSERNDSWTLTGEPAHTEPVRFIQMWVLPEQSGATPSYEQLEIADERLQAGLIPIASGMPQHRDDTAVTIGNRHAALHGARMQPRADVELPTAPYLHLFVARGAVTLEGAGLLNEGDAVRFTASGGHRVTATQPSEILVWEMHTGLGGV